jgi:hypothetical protein
MKAQVLKWKCCGEVYAVCIEPHCYTSRDWLKDVRQAVKDGDGIEMVDIADAKLSSCKCKLELKS